MSTLRTLFLAAPLIASATVHTTTNVQGSTGPGKLYGPSIISASSSKALSKAATDQTYTYTVELNHVSGTDTTVYVTDETASAQPTVYTVVVPANQLTATFDVVAAFPGDDTLDAYNANSSASMDVVVL